MEKSDAILRRLVALANERGSVVISDDWGGNSITLAMDGCHTHVGDPDATWEQFIDELHALLIDGSGLSFAQDK